MIRACAATRTDASVCSHNVPVRRSENRFPSIDLWQFPRIHFSIGVPQIALLKLVRFARHQPWSSPWPAADCRRSETAGGRRAWRGHCDGVARRRRCHPRRHLGVPARELIGGLGSLLGDQTLDSTDSRDEAVAAATNLWTVLRLVVTADVICGPQSGTRLQNPNFALNPSISESERELGQARERFSNRASASVAKTTCTIQTNKRRIAVMVAPHLSGLLVLQSDFGPRPVLSCRHDVSDFSPKSGLWRGSQHQTAAAVPRLH